MSDAFTAIAGGADEFVNENIGTNSTPVATPSVREHLHGYAKVFRFVSKLLTLKNER
ncbi:hypothetical protein SAMN05421827_102159 [Pedobacter terrae]|uniref:Uncharacterized protein n=1 Tax=Pedobacter terrae TaxID=405671 RepID=A0A1G7Q406_9SPHI|nr:hypothetical protein [Pedobacter terrae]SDF93198.1 hypothetical protein SAMN05421827_102159 [Pedobacter terrae]